MAFESRVNDPYRMRFARTEKLAQQVGRLSSFI